MDYFCGGALAQVARQQDSPVPVCVCLHSIVLLGYLLSMYIVDCSLLM